MAVDLAAMLPPVTFAVARGYRSRFKSAMWFFLSKKDTDDILSQNWDFGATWLSFLWFCRTWTKRYLITSQTRVKRVSRIHHRTILKEVIRYRLVQSPTKSQKKDFSGWRPAIAFLYLFLFHSLLRLSFLSFSIQKWTPDCHSAENFTVASFLFAEICHLLFLTNYVLCIDKHHLDRPPRKLMRMSLVSLFLWRKSYYRWQNGTKYACTAPNKRRCFSRKFNILVSLLRI